MCESSQQQQLAQGERAVKIGRGGRGVCGKVRQSDSRQACYLTFDKCFCIDEATPCIISDDCVLINAATNKSALQNSCEKTNEDNGGATAVWYPVIAVDK